MKMRALAIVLLISAAAIAAAPTTVAAADNPSIFEDVTESVGTFLDALLGAARGEFARLTDDGADRDASEAADDLQSEFNANSGTLEDWINSRSNASGAMNVVEFELDVDGDESTVFLVADVTDGAYENASIVDSMDRTVDDSCELEGAAARNAADELETFVDTYAEDDQDVDAGYLARLDRQYRDLVDCSFPLEP